MKEVGVGIGEGEVLGWETSFLPSKSGRSLSLRWILVLA